MSRESIVEVVRRGENQGGTNGHYSIGDQAERTVNYGCAERKEQHADNAPGNYASDMMSAKPERESDDADRQHDEEHLTMKMSLAELTHKRYHRNEYGQRQAMQKADSRQCHGSIVEKSRMI